MKIDITEMDPLSCILKFMRYVCLHHFKSMSIKLLLSKEPVHLGKSFKDWAAIFTGTLALHSPLCRCI